jgi:predicted AAA+ superfamily ATPase
MGRWPFQVNTLPRRHSRERRRLAKTFPEVALVWPRQVGKASTRERVFPGYRYVSLDVGANAEAAETKPRDFFDAKPTPVILDEIQYALSFFRKIQIVMDASKREKGAALGQGPSGHETFQEALLPGRLRAIIACQKDFFFDFIQRVKALPRWTVWLTGSHQASPQAPTMTIEHPEL